MSEKKRRSAAKEKEMQQFIGGLKRLTDKGVPIYMDGEDSGPPDWERLFEVREDKMFYMGDYVQTDTGVLKEVRFDKVYLSDKDIQTEKKNGKGRESRS